MHKVNFVQSRHLVPIYETHAHYCCNFVALSRYYRALVRTFYRGVHTSYTSYGQMLYEKGFFYFFFFGGGGGGAETWPLSSSEIS